MSSRWQAEPMAKRKVPLGPIRRGGVALPFGAGGKEIKMTFCEPTVVGRVFEALRQLPTDPHFETILLHIVRSTLAARLKPFTPGVDDPIEWVAAELTRSIQAGILMDQVPEFDRMTNKQKLAQLDMLDAAITQLDEAFGELRREAWNEVVSVKPDLPDEPTIVRAGVYNLWRGLHEAVRGARRRLQESAPNRGSRPNGPASRAASEAGKVYQWITGKEAKVYWDDAAGQYKGEFLPFLTEIFKIFDIEGEPATYVRD
jgi:hypothetical protein